MRIPFDKIYRAFPELDQFTDAQCEGYVREAREQHAHVMWGWGALGVVSLIPGLIVTGVVGSGLQAVCFERARHDSPVVLGLALLIGGVATGVVGMSLRDIGLRKAIGKRLEGARCPKCSYSLLGLEVRAGDVLCPECGHVEHLADRGLSARDIMGVERGEERSKVGG